MLLSIVTTISVTKAQTVETLVINDNIRDGMHVDDAGNVYTTSGGLRSGFFIGFYEPMSKWFDVSFLGGFNGPIDIDELANGNLIVTNYDVNTVSKYDVSEGKLSTIATGLDGPAGIAIDSDDVIYVSNFGAPPNYAGHQIHKITPDGEVSVLADSSVLIRFQALVFNGDGELVVSSDNKLFKVDLETGELEQWVDLQSFGFGHMIYRYKDSCIYGTSTGEGRIYKIERSGEYSVFAGNIKGYLDGDLDQARFDAPLGIGISPDENVIYVGDNTRLRKITLGGIVDVENEDQTQGSLFPNPTQGIVRTESDNVAQLVVWNASGVRVAESESNELNLEQQPSGVYYVGVYNRQGNILRTEVVVKH